jgi:glutathione S-transferase
MTDEFELVGLEDSGYSVKVRSALRSKEIPFRWTNRSLKNNAFFKKHAQVPLLPLILLPDRSTMQDSTPILEYLEAQYPEPSIHPDEPASRFVSILLEWLSPGPTRTTSPFSKSPTFA